MSEIVCLLITILCDDQLLRVGLRLLKKQATEDVFLYPMEPENRKILHSLLPDYWQGLGPIVEVEELYDMEDITKG